ncbi:glycoside hydrolase family 30 protein [Paramyrothecium foliicola]|nr:glycoside hydrolase family 30 protein [Paramyrothecium foliicola]
MPASNKTTKWYDPNFLALKPFKPNTSSPNIMLLHLPTLLLLAPVVAGNNVVRQSRASAWISTKDGRYKLGAFDAPILGATNPGIDSWDFSIAERSQRKQTIKGFGAAVTDGTVTAFNKLPSNLRSQLLRDLMTKDGINLNLMRHTIASSDLSGNPAYSYDDNGGNVDLELRSFNLGDRGNAMVRMLAEMRSLQPDLTIVGSPWAPPAWMQLDRVLTGTTVNNNLNHQYENQYAQYFVKYLQAYEAGGARVDAITIQNEPLNSRRDMPTMYIFEDESGRLIRDKVGPAIRGAGLKTQIWAFDHNTQDYSYPQTVANLAPQYVSAAAWHCYSGIEPDKWTALARYHNEFPNLEQYMTECWTSTQPGGTDWIHTSSFALLPLQNWANGIIAWALGSYTNGGPTITGNDACHICTGLVTVDPTGASFKKEIDYYMIGQFSKFMVKGGKILGGTGSFLYGDQSGMLQVASLNPDGTRTVVIQNRFKNDIWVQLRTESESQTWNGRVLRESVTTWVLPAA